jgi:histidine triad (HIT) family protein
MMPNDATGGSCVFCDIVRGLAPASVVYRDDVIMAFMNIRPIAPGECLVIPLKHVDHFTDVDDPTSERIIVLAQRIGRRVRKRFSPERVGMVVHGYGVPHAHLIVVPQHGPTDITSGRFVRIEGGQIVFRESHLPLSDRATLDAHARMLATD